MNTERKVKKMRESKKMVQAQKLSQRIRLLGDNYDVLRRSGLEKSPTARDLLQTRNALVYDRDKLVKEDTEDRRMSARLLLQCLAMCDALTVAVEMFRDHLIKVYENVSDAENDFAALLWSVAKEAGDVVTMIDKAGDFNMSMNYAAMADEVTEAVLVAAYDVVHKHYEADNGNNITFK